MDCKKPNMEDCGSTSWEEHNYLKMGVQSQAYAEEIGSQEVEIINVSIDDVGTTSNTCHYFVHVDEDDSNTRGPSQVDVDEDCDEDCCPISESLREATLPNFSHCH
jgi:hypothetical protein